MLAAHNNADLVVFLFAVIALALIGAAVNRVQRWWAQVTADFRRNMQQSASRGRAGMPPLPRPIIRERLPDRPPPLRSPPQRKQPQAPAKSRPAKQRKPAVATPSAPAATPVATASSPVAAVAAAIKERVAENARAAAPAPVARAAFTPAELRKAIVLSELLAPPLALREE